MRATLIIFCIYTLILPLIPCGDVVCNETEIHLEAKAADDCDENTDNCSSFCYCDCCITAVYNIPANEFSSLTSTSPVLTAHYSSVPLFIALNNIWQPPRMV